MTDHFDKPPSNDTFVSYCILPAIPDVNNEILFCFDTWLPLSREEFPAPATRRQSSTVVPGTLRCRLNHSQVLYDRTLSIRIAVQAHRRNLLLRGACPPFSAGCKIEAVFPFASAGTGPVLTSKYCQSQFNRTTV